MPLRNRIDPVGRGRIFEDEEEEFVQPSTLTGRRDNKPKRSDKTRVKGRMLRPVRSGAFNDRDDLLSATQRRAKLSRAEELGQRGELLSEGAEEQTSEPQEQSSERSTPDDMNLENLRRAGLSERDIQNLRRQDIEEDTLGRPDGLKRRMTDFGDRGVTRDIDTFENGGVSVVTTPGGLARRGVVNHNQSRGNVSTIPSESFTNPQFVGFNSGENIARAVRADFQREQTEEAERRLRDRQLREDANLNLSGDMSLVELANAAARRRSARNTLRQREENQAAQQVAAQELAQERNLRLTEEQGRNRRAGLKARSELVGEQRKATAERRERNREILEGLHVDEEGNVNQQAVSNTLSFIEASNRDPGELNAGEVQKFSTFNTLKENINQNARKTVVENMSELRDSIGNIDKEVLNTVGGFLRSAPISVLTLGTSNLGGRFLQYLDETDVRLRNKRGQQTEQINLGDLARTPEQRRALLEIISDNIERGRETDFSAFL